MCGLYGVYGSIGILEKKVLCALQMFSQLRGRDSSGIAIVSHNSIVEPVIFKGVGGQESLVLDNSSIFDQDTWNLKPTVLGQCVIGHSRAATSGVVSDKNAHPFNFDKIVGCHNGTVWDFSIKDFECYEKGLIDSQVLLAEINTGKDLGTILEKVRGAWALVWWDKETNTLNMCRNDERLLFVANMVNKRTLYWASESWMLDVALRRAGIKPEEFKIFIVSEDKHLIYEKNTQFKIQLKESIKIEKHVFITYPKEPTYKGPKKSNVLPLVPKKSRKSRKKTNEQEKFEEEYVGTFEGLYIKRREFENLVRNGCDWCGDKQHMDWEHRNTITWYEEEHPVCKVCSELTETRSIH